MNFDLTLAICVYNADRYLHKTLLSIVQQTTQNFHLLIIDDCSTDNSCQIVSNFFKANPRQYQLIQFEQNRGIAYARNYALNIATTKYLLFIDSDDIIDPQLVEKEYNKIISDNDLIGVSCWSEFINENDEKINGGTFLGETTKEKFIKKASLKKLIFLPIHTLFNREYAIKHGGFCIHGFPEGKPRLQDYCEELDLWTRMSDSYKEGKAIITIPEILYQYRKIDGLSSNHFNMIIKMRYTKANLLRRRNGKDEQTFIEFYESLTQEELNSYHQEAKAADTLRNGIFYLKNKELSKAIFLIFTSLWNKPSYIFDKIRHNFKLKK